MRLILICRPSEGGRLSRPVNVQPVPKAAYRSDFRENTNFCPQRDSNMGPLAQHTAGKRATTRPLRPAGFLIQSAVLGTKLTLSEQGSSPGKKCGVDTLGERRARAYTCNGSLGQNP